MSCCKLRALNWLWHYSGLTRAVLNAEWLFPVARLVGGGCEVSVGRVVVPACSTSQHCGLFLAFVAASCSSMWFQLRNIIGISLIDCANLLLLMCLVACWSPVLLVETLSTPLDSLFLCVLIY